MSNVTFLAKGGQLGVWPGSHVMFWNKECQVQVEVSNGHFLGTMGCCFFSWQLLASMFFNDFARPSPSPLNVFESISGIGLGI